MSLIAENLSFSYNKKDAIIANLSLEIGSTERVGIKAKSGAGKTTLMKLLAGYEQPDLGKILVDEEPLNKKGYCKVQMIWQHPEKSVNPRWKMKEVLEEAGVLEAPFLEGLGIKKEWLSRYPQELSGGELQRFCIARALGQETKYLIADEITTMLDPITKSQIWNFLLQETKRREMGMIIVSHSQDLLDRVTTRTIALK